MKNVFHNFLLVLSFVGITSCNPEIIPVRLGMQDSSERAELTLEFDEVGMQTRASLLEGSEDKNSGALVAVYYSASGLMDSVQEIPAEAFATADSPSVTTATISVPLGQEVELSIIGNMWAISKSNNQEASLAIAFGEDFPSRVSELREWSYFLDGRDINKDYRFQTMSEVADYGIPFSAKLEGRTYYGSESVSIDCRRLFSKISLTIDHSGLDAGENPDYFRNVKLHVRQANCHLTPFSGQSQKAVSGSDTIDGDYDPSMINASKMCFELYVPENMQGTLLKGNSDPELKSREHILSVLGAGQEALLSYLEFSGELNPEAGGYGGPVTYRFYLGNDNCSNFDLEGNRLYDIRLGFNVSSLFDPYWKVNPDLTDNREIGIAADQARSRLLPDRQMIAVRKNRPGEVYVYVKAGQGGRIRRPDSLCDPSDPPSSLIDCGITGDFISKSNRPSDLPMLSELKALGISPSYDEESGLLSFTVTDQSKFVAGKEVKLTLSTVPEGKSTELSIRTFENISAEWNASLSEDFVPGMSRTVSYRGFSSDVSYRSTTTHCYKDEATAGTGGVIQSNYDGNPGLASSGKFKLYNFSNCSADVCIESMFYMRPGDDFNDGNNDGVLDDADALGFRLVNSTPFVEFYGMKLSDRIELDAAGTEEEIYLTIGIKEGSSVRALYMRDFDPEIFDLIYQPRLRTGFGTTELKDDEGNILYSGGEDSYIGMSVTSKRTASGWPIYDIYRSKIGEKYSIRQAKTYIGYFIDYMPSLYKEGALHARFSTQIKISFLPFLAKDFDVSFEDEYHDYTFCNSKYLDYEFRRMAENSLSAPSGKNVDFGLKDRSTLKLYARPLASTERNFTTEGKSESIMISQETEAGPLTMSFIDTGSNNHSAGPHNVYASFMNKHSGEVKEEILGDFSVYVHFAVGMDVEINNYGGMGSFGDIRIIPRLMSDVSRCSYSEVDNLLCPELWIKSGYNFEYYSGNEGGGYTYGTLTFPPESGVIGDRTSSVKILPESYDLSDPVTIIIPECRYDISMYSHIWNDAYAFIDMCREYPYMFCDLIATNGDYVFRFDNGSSAGVRVFEDTAWSDLRSAEGKGYYHFHLLDELRADSKAWIPLFKYYAGLP